jgi:Ser/Thr protein kinase RdoA (MazF antagonist)
MESPTRVQTVLSAYPRECQPGKLEALGSAGGFSGAGFWRLHTATGTLCLRRWPPEHPSPQRLAFIHRVLQHVANQGFAVVPVPLRNRAGNSYLAQEGCLWELTRWLPGEADYHRNPSAAKLEAAMQSLARFHLAAASFAGSPPNAASATGISERLGLLTRLEQGGYRRLVAAVREGADLPRPAHPESTKRMAGAERSGAPETVGRTSPGENRTESWAEFSELASRILDLFSGAAGDVKSQLLAATRVRVPIQVCIRDVWHDHVLFQEDQVSGLVDFGSMRYETVAADVGRLLGSLVRDDEEGWKEGLAAYQDVRPMSAEERQLSRAYDSSTSLLGGINWLRWIYLENRHFHDWRGVLARLRDIADRLERLAARASNPRGRQKDQHPFLF